MTETTKEQRKPGGITGKGFVKGDPRINRKGRAIRGKDALRHEWEAIWSEILFDSEGKPIMDEVTGKALTRLRGRMRTMTTSRNVKELELALAYTFGKPKEEIDMNNSGETVTKVIIEYGDDSTGKTAPATQSTEPNKAGAEEA